MLAQAIETTFHDIRYAGRALLRSPGFAAIVVATLALGIGANLTMFSVMRAVLWRPLPYPEPDRIVMIEVDARNVINTGATLGEVLDLKERSRSVEQVSMINSGEADVELGGQTERLAMARVSDDFLPLLGGRPALGRTLDSRIDTSQERDLAILISDELWHRQFSADPGVIGKALRINGVDVQIAGVLPAGFRLFLPPSISASEQIDVWASSVMSATRQYRGIPIVARLKPGVTLDQANAELQTIAAQFEREYPEYYSGVKGWQASPSDQVPGATVRFTARSLHQEMTRDARPALFLLWGAVGFVLLIACVNVANLMLARGSARQRELEVRRALGAGRVQIIRQLLTESLMLAVFSAVVGLLCARGALEAIARLNATHIPLQSRVGMDASVAVFAPLLSLVTTMLFGLLPAWRMASGSPGHSLHSSRAQTAGSGARRLQRMLVVAEIALSIVPLACGGLMLRSFLNLQHSPLGFNPANVMTAIVRANLAGYPDTERWALLQRMIDGVRALPGVQAVSAANPLPLAGGQQTRRVGNPDHPDAPPILAIQQVAIPGYLNVIGTPLLEGRDFTDDDVVRGRDVTIIDERLAQRLLPDGAIGKRLSVYRTGHQQDLEVIGVTSTVRDTRVRDESIGHFIIPLLFYPNAMTLVIKTPETAQQLTPGIKLAMAAAARGGTASDIRAMSDYVSDSIGDTRFILLVLSAFAIASVLLAAIGLYATLTYLTTQRTREFGIRLALGSSIRAIVAIVIRESALLAVIGVVMGLVGVAAVTRTIQELLYDVRPLDGVTLIGVVIMVALIALGAAAVPAWRATRIDPQTSLRSE